MDAALWVAVGSRSSASVGSIWSAKKEEEVAAAWGQG